MKTIILELDSRYTGYKLNGEPVESIEHLINFLRSDYKLNIKKELREMFLKNEEGFFSTPAYSIEWDKNTLSIADIYDDDWAVALTPMNSITMNKANFLQILDRWDELVAKRPDQIIFTQDDQGYIALKGRFNNGQEL